MCLSVTKAKGQSETVNQAGDSLTSTADWISKSSSQPGKGRGSELGGKSGLQKHIINSNNTNLIL